MESQELKNIIEAALLASEGPLTVDQIRALFGERSAPERQEIRKVLTALQEDYEGRGIELKQVASGFRIQVRESMSHWLAKLWEERPPRYSRALMETLAIIAYRQPVTRGDVEDIRGVSVTTNIIRTLLERNWIKVVGHRDVPGKPAMFGTTREFLDYFDLKKLDDLPPLAELADLEPAGVQLELDENQEAALSVGDEARQAQDEADASASSDKAEDDDTDDGAAIDGINDSTDESASDAQSHGSGTSPDADSMEFSGDDEPAYVDVPPGSVAPLVGLSSPDEEEREPATVTSLDAVRARG